MNTIHNIRLGRSLKMIAVAIGGFCLFGLLAAGCNDHRFTPLAEIEVYPDVIEYEVQRADNVIEQVLISNRSVSARMEIFEIAFEDSSGTPLAEEELNILDQSISLRTLQKTSNKDGSQIAYSSFSAGIVSNVSCADDSYCHCDPTQGGDCTLEDGQKERMGEMFSCTQNPIDSSTSEKVCTAYYKFYNNAGKTTEATWGGSTKFDCTKKADCSRLGPEYICLPPNEDGEMKCGSDIQSNFSLECGLEQLVAVDDSIVNKDNAAKWTGLGGKELCMKGDSEPDMEFYGLNRCDQIAIKQQLHAIDNGDVNAGYQLYPMRQANYRLMISPLDFGQSDLVAFCDGGTITNATTILDDPIPMEESCLDDSGQIKTELLSVDPSAVRFDQLPIRILYTIDNEYDSADVLSQKFINMRIFNSARVGGSFERTVTLDLRENRGGPPTPIIKIPEDEMFPEPLDVIHLDGRESTSPFGDDRKPFEYYWEWLPGGKPAHAQDAVLIPSTGSFDTPHSIMGAWTSEGYPKIYFPIAGEYGIRMKVRDSANVPSGPNDDCPDCKEWDEIWIDVRPSQKLHVELIWDRGDDVDLDLFLVRFRPDGTFAVPAPFQDKVVPTTASMNACTEDADCFGGAFSCGPDNMCINECANDDECKAVDPGWFCNEYDECQKNEDDIIECESDEDCRGNGYCNPSKVGLSTYKMICTKHDGESLFDTCSHINKNPRWGDYEAVNMSCVDDVDCNGVGSDIFTCQATRCALACQNSGECLTLSDQFLCGDNSSCIGNNIDDDPTLDIDDVNGWGPENISLKEPRSGRYRIVARLYADPLDVVSDEGPLSPVKAFVLIYLNGELAISKGIAHELTDTNIYWKIADIVWDEEGAGGAGDGYAEPLCAGWNLTKCFNTEECTEWYGEDFSCATRDWGKYCSNCTSGQGTPEECVPTTTSCSSDSECQGETSAKKCAVIKGDYCTCTGSNPFGEFEQDPYANPFHTSGGTLFDPNGSATRSMWCDSATMSSHSVPGSGQVDILSDGAACSTLYQ